MKLPFRLTGLALLALVVTAALAFGPGPASAAALKFPALTGRVVDDAHVLSPQVQQQLTDQLAQLEAQTHHQLVVATLSSLQGDDIADYGYQLGRAWGIGQKGQVRIEVGYGLEAVLTDALTSVIIQTRIVPKFKAGDISGGVVDGTQAIVDQLALPADQAQAKAAAAVKPVAQTRSRGSPLAALPVLLILAFVFLMLRGGGGRGLGGALPWILLGALGSGRRDDGWGGGGGGGFGGGGGGGGFSGGGGSFGGGGSSGSW
jgi:uncharacterized protein